MNVRWARPLAAMGALLLAAGSLRQCRAERAARAVDLRLWESTGAAERHSDAAARARRDPDPVAVRVALSRSLFRDASDVQRLAQLPSGEAAIEARRADAALRTATALAADALRERPSSWESAMLLGGLRMLDASRTTSDDLYRVPGRWRDPLRQATTLAPGSAEPPRLLLAGTLASWHALPDSEREAGRRLLRTSFADRATLDQILPAWAAAAASEEELTSVLPAEPHPYEVLQQARARQHDWPGVCAARHRWLPLLVADLERQLTAAESRLNGGDLAGGRQALMAVVAQAPPDRRTAPLFTRAVEALPAGPISPSQASSLATWLDWALPLEQLGQPALAGPVLGRAAGLSPEVAPERAALAELLSGDLDRAEVLERRAERLWSEEWAPYAVAKTEALLARGDVEEAAATLAAVHRIYQTRLPYVRAREHLAQARHEVAVPLSSAGLAATAWPGGAWLYLAGEPRLELLAARAATGVRLAVDIAPPEGSVAELSWDGRVVGCVPLVAGGVLRVPVQVTAGAHLLRLRSLSGARIAPGRVELVAPGAAR